MSDPNGNSDEEVPQEPDVDEADNGELADIDLDDDPNLEFHDVFDENNTYLICPVCDLHFQLVDFRNHMLHTHPEFLAIWASALFGPMFQPEEYLNYVRSMLVDTEEYDIDNMTYEQLLELCEQIGDHKEGIQDIEVVLEKVECVDSLTETNCPVCLEEFSTKHAREIEKIKSCGHIFCSDCIRKWFTENKRCPMCKADAQTAKE